MNLPNQSTTKDAVKLEPSQEEVMVKFGITRESVEYFRCGEYRYTNLKDAIAQAKRQQQTR